ncbi:MAG: class I SAM-dependent methyltransferase [Candidatus Hermodarchaeia archaeon]
MDLIDKLLRPFRLNSSRVHLERFLLEIAGKLDKDNRVLDAGAGDGKYSHIFKHCTYHSTDIKQVIPSTEKLTYLSNLESVPIETDQYDLVICNQVLEHVPQPQLIINELFRVLKADGELWLTAPLYYEEHGMPDDYFRFTKSGLLLIIESAGFKVKEIDWLEGYFGTLSYELRKAARELPLDPRKIGNRTIGLIIVMLNIILKPTFFLLSVFFAYVDTAHKYQVSGNCKNYTVIAIKPIN